LVSDGLAAVDCDEGELLAGQAGSGEVTLVHDPWRPVPGRGGHLGLDPGPCDRRDLDRRCDVACFTSAPLREPLRLEGRPRLRLRVGADQPSFDLCGALSLLPRNSPEVRQLSTGFGRFQARPSCGANLELKLHPLGVSLEAGDRLRLSLAGSAWPQIAVNPGDGTLATGAPGPRHRVITLKFELAETKLYLSRLLGEEQ
jgi:predicted acyl esterase